MRRLPFVGGTSRQSPRCWSLVISRMFGCFGGLAAVIGPVLYLP
jgi:hypothetical protein